MTKELIIGSHQSVSSPEMLVGTVKNAISDGANTFMIYLNSPQSTFRRKFDSYRKDEAFELMREHNINPNNIIVHAPYIINLANSIDQQKISFAMDFLKKEIEIANRLGFSIIVVHPGSHLGLGSDVGISQLSKTINNIFSEDQTNVKIAIETMAGKKNEIGSNLDELSKIYQMIENKNRIGFCLDTCHLHDSGVDLSNFDEYLKQFSAVIPLDKIMVVHVNDSKNICNSHKDRHENIGYGNIGFDNLIKIVHHPLLLNVPKILETPYIGNVSPYKFEIKCLKERKMDYNFKKLC